MDFESKIKSAIVDETTKLIAKHHAYHNELHIDYLRKMKRYSPVPTKHVQTPGHWQINRLFNPFYVYKHRSSIAMSVANKIKNGTYIPALPAEALIPKVSGGSRRVNIYQIPDAAVSSLFYKLLLDKNKHRFSPYSYAYRSDRNVHFAIQDISVELKKHSRLFIAEFDFKKFFDSIDHDYLFAQFDENGFKISIHDRQVIKAFIAGRREGIPQGTSISLFLANLVCWRLDYELNRAGLMFARYADDTVIWSDEYSKITKAFSVMQEFSKDAGVKINFKKSEGISLLCSDEMPSEIAKRKENFEYLGYTIAVNKISIKDDAVLKIKKQITYILYKHLIQPLTVSQLRAINIPANNEDVHLVSALLEVRRYLYGNLSEGLLRSYLSGQNKRLFFKGIMSFYPLIDDEEQLKCLDGWLVTAIYKALKKRGKLLVRRRFNIANQFPFNVTRSDLIRQFRSQVVLGKRLYEVPSFLAIYNAIQKNVSDYGIESVRSSPYGTP